MLCADSDEEWGAADDEYGDVLKGSFDDTVGLDEEPDHLVTMIEALCPNQQGTGQRATQSGHGTAT
eukprot:6655445-Lingulodinium_polyedra.AAC.1